MYHPYTESVVALSDIYIIYKEVFSHPYISFFHLLVDGFSVIYIYKWTPTPITLPRSRCMWGNKISYYVKYEVNFMS